MLYGREQNNKGLFNLGDGDDSRAGKGVSCTDFWKTRRATVTTA
jgi:hypothetical protein